MGTSSIEQGGTKTLIPSGIRLHDGGIPVTLYSGRVPFLLTHNTERWDRIQYGEDGVFSLECGARADYVCFLGHTSSFDEGTGSWFSPRGDMSKEQFVGDPLGSIKIIYEDGEAGGGEDNIPLIFGSTIWWDMPIKSYQEPFKSDPGARAILNGALMINRLRSAKEDFGEGCCFYSVIATKGRKISKIEVSRILTMFGYPVVSGITFLSDRHIQGYSSFPEPIAGVDLSDVKIITPGASNGVSPAASGNGWQIEKLKRLLYTFRDECESAQFSLIEMDKSLVRPPAAVPDVVFSGGRYGTMLTNIYRANIIDLVKKTDPDNHMTPTSTVGMPAWGAYTDSIGTWRPNFGRGNNEASAGIWSRDGGKAGIERRRFGLRDLNPKEMHNLDECLYYAVPPHWTRDITNLFGHSKYIGKSFDGEQIFGVAENDGHGCIMLLRYTDWLYERDKENWFSKHRQATIDSCEWICWCLDHKFSKEQPDGIIWSITEPAGWGGTEPSGWGAYDIYSNIICLYGLKACMRIFASHGEESLARKYAGYEDRLSKGIDAHLTVRTAGKAVWRPHGSTAWQDRDELLAPVFMAADIFGYDLNSGAFDESWHKTANDSFEDRIMTEPKYNHARAFGYGQGYITQAALLLDRLSDADELLKRMCDYLYYEKCEPWIVPEGAVVHPSLEYWHRMGDHGNTAQQVEIIKVIRLMIGIDDIAAGSPGSPDSPDSPDSLNIMPRLPECVNKIEVNGFPTLCAAGGTRKVSYTFERGEGAIFFEGDFSERESGSGINVRLGPVPLNCDAVCGKPPYKKEAIGEGCWLWFKLEPGVQSVKIEF